MTIPASMCPFFEELPPTLPQGANNLTIKVHKLDQHKSAWQHSQNRIKALVSHLIYQPKLVRSILMFSKKADVGVGLIDRSAMVVDDDVQSHCGMTCFQHKKKDSDMKSHLNFYLLHVHFVPGAVPGFSRMKPAVLIALPFLCTATVRAHVRLTLVHIMMDK